MVKKFEILIVYDILQMKIKAIYDLIKQKHENKISIQPVNFQVQYKNKRFTFFFSILTIKRRKKVVFQAIKYNENLKTIGKQWELSKQNGLQDIITCFINKYLIDNYDWKEL